MQWLASCLHLKMKKNNEKLRYILQYYYDKGKNAAQACEKICAVYGEGALSKSAARKWFARFRSGNFDVKDEPRSGRPVTEKVDEILEKVQQDKHISSVDVGMELGIDHKTVLNYLHYKAGYKKKLDIWVPHELSAKNMIDRINICDTLLKRNEIDPFLKRVITGDEKWITYDNTRKRKRSWIKDGEPSQAFTKPELTSKKVLLCVCVVRLEGNRPLLPSGQTIDSQLYCEQLERLR